MITIIHRTYSSAVRGTKRELPAVGAVGTLPSRATVAVTPSSAIVAALRRIKWPCGHEALELKFKEDNFTLYDILVIVPLNVDPAVVPDLYDIAIICTKEVDFDRG
jgi:hypothetical protein